MKITTDLHKAHKTNAKISDLQKQIDYHLREAAKIEKLLAIL